MFDEPAILILGLEALFLTVVIVIAFRLWLDKRRHAVFTALMEDVFNAPGRGIILYDHNDNLVRANDEAYQFISTLSDDPSAHDISFVSGMPSTMKGFLDYMFDHAVDVDQSLKNALDKLSQQRSGQGFREVIAWGDDQLCLVEASSTSAGRQLVALYDLSRAKSDEDKTIKLSRFSDKLVHAIEAVNSGIIIAKRVDDAYRVLFANQAFEEYSGLPSADTIGKPVRRIFNHLTTHERSLKKIDEALRSQSQGDIDLKAGQEKDKPRWFNVQLTPTEMDDEDVFIAVFTDITDLKIREQELSRTQKMEALGQLAAGVAHDFNNILSIVGGYARIADSNFGENETLSDYLQKIQNATDRGASLTSQLLTFSRHKIVTESVIDLSQTLKEQSSLLTPLLPASIVCSFDVDTEGLVIDCAVDDITQVMMNLALNARDAMPDGGAITIGSHLCEGGDVPLHIREKTDNDKLVCFSVKDDGCGIKPEILEKIFDPFFTTKDQGKGTGLGLFMVYGLVKQMSGFIDVDSTPGQGTIFSVFWPLSDKQPTKVMQGSIADVESINLEGYTALVAEDEPDLLALVSSMLERLGMTVLAAANGNEALVLQDDHMGDVDLLLTDVVMPELGGVKLAELMQEMRPDTHILFMSGYPAGASETGASLPDGATLIAKPIDYENLARIIFEKLTNKDVNKFIQTDQGRAAHWETSEVEDGVGNGSIKSS